jgi:hypothetical protein
MEALHDVVKAGKAPLHRCLVDVGLAVSPAARRCGGCPSLPPQRDPVRVGHDRA